MCEEEVMVSGILLILLLLSCIGARLTVTALALFSPLTLATEDGPTMPPLTPKEQEIYDEENAEDTEEADKKPAASTSTSNSAAAVAASTARVNNPSDNHPADATDMNHLYEWMPIYAISLWKNGDMDEQVTLAILLPSGIGSMEDSQVRVDDNLYEVHVRVKWPTIASVVSALHSLWNLPEYHPKLVGFHDFFSNLRERESDSLYSEATISLPMRVQKTPVEFHRLGDQSGARVLYVTYCAVQKNDYKGIEDTDFVMVGDDQSKVTP
jgi:hypothetical protein